MNIVGKLKKHGVQGSTKIALDLAARKVRKLRNSYYRWDVRNAPKHSDATSLGIG